LAAIFLRNLWLPFLFPQSSNTTPESARTLGTGDIQVTLSWSNINDLDLWVIDPAAEKIYFEHPFSQSGGKLDVDANRGCQENMTSVPIENIFWPTNGAPQGSYTIYVNYYRICDLNEIEASYTVRLLVDGKLQTFSGAVSQQDDTKEVVTFSR
jgi:uncharacterized protein YfaP (DUF2135 family)